jgi:hypothetical protein
MVFTSRTIIPCRSTSCIAGAYLRRSSAVHAIRVVPARSGRQIGAGRRGASQEGMQISMLAFEQALSPLRHGLMASPPDRPRDDERRLDPTLG